MGNNNRNTKSVNTSHNNPNTWVNRHLYKPKKILKSPGEKHPDLQIDGSMSIRQMVQRYNQGMSIPVSSYEYLDGETLHPSADLIEKQEYLEKYSKIANSEVVERGSGGETSPPVTTTDKSQETKTNES